MFRDFSLSSSEKTRSKYFRIILYILTLGIIFIPNDVFAQNVELGTPYYYVTEVGDSSVLQGNSSLVGWWGSNNYFWSNYYLGSSSGDPNVFYRQDYNFNNANLCVNNDILISGYVGGLFNFFTDNSYQLDIYNNNEKMACTTEIQESGSRLYYSCSGKGGGTYSITVKTNTFNGNQYQVGVSKNVNVTCNPTSTDIINNQNDNTNNIINNQNNNTQTIIDNFNNTINDTFTDCKLSKNLFDGKIESGRYGTTTGNPISDNAQIRSVNFIPVKPNTTYIFSNNGTGISMNIYQYNSSYNFLEFVTVSGGSSFTTSNDTYYLKFSRSSGNYDKIQLEQGSTITMYEVYGENCTNKIDQTNDKLDNIDGTLNNDNVDDATGDGRDFFNNFYLDDNGGISDIVTLPLRVINGLISGENNCSALNFILFDKEMYFPGGCIMWGEVSSANETLYQTIICGFFGYILLTKLFKDIEDLKNPNKEDVSTLDL